MTQRTAPIPLTPFLADLSINQLQSAPERITEGVKPIRREDRQQDGDWLLRPDRPGNRGTSQDNRREKTELNAVRLAILDAVASEGI